LEAWPPIEPSNWFRGDVVLLSSNPFFRFIKTSRPRQQVRWTMSEKPPNQPRATNQNSSQKSSYQKRTRAKSPKPSKMLLKTSAKHMKVNKSNPQFKPPQNQKAKLMHMTKPSKKRRQKPHNINHSWRDFAREKRPRRKHGARIRTVQMMLMKNQNRRTLRAWPRRRRSLRRRAPALTSS